MNETKKDSGGVVMFLESVLLGLLVGGLRGGRISNLGEVHIRGGALLVVLFLLQMLPALLGRMSFMLKYGHVIAFLMTLGIGAVVGMNIGKKGIWAVAAGFLMNLLAMMTHGLKMPVLISSLTMTGRTELANSITGGVVINYTGMQSISGFWDGLGKVLPLPGFYPFAQILSLGDIFIGIGLFIFVFSEMTFARNFKTKSRMFQMPYR